MIELIINNPHYIMYGMIGIFVVVVALMIMLAANGDLRPKQRGQGKLHRRNANAHGDGFDSGLGDSGGSSGGE